MQKLFIEQNYPCGLFPMEQMNTINSNEPYTYLQKSNTRSPQPFPKGSSFGSAKLFVMK